MKKYIALVLLLSFTGLLWAQHDTCLQKDDVTANTDEECVDVQTGDVPEEQLGSLKRQTYSVENLIGLNNHDNNADIFQLTSKPSFIYTQEYFASDQDTTEATNFLNLKWYHACCCLGGVIALVVIVGYIYLFWGRRI